VVGPKYRKFRASDPLTFDHCYVRQSNGGGGSLIGYIGLYGTACNPHLLSPLLLLYRPRRPGHDFKLHLVIRSCIYLRILIISYIATFLGTNGLYVLMCRKAWGQDKRAIENS